MHTLIVHCHPELRSFNAALKDVAVETLQRLGHTVEVSDLYAEGFDPMEGPTHYADRADPDFFSALAEQRHGSKAGALSSDVGREIERLERAELVVFQFPIWWHAQPAMLKGWLDRVFVNGGLYTSKVERNSRCVTVHYRNMHLDLCPAVLREDQPARTSTMFHHNKERSERYRHIRNPWGFADWFNGSLPQERDFATFYAERGLATLKSEAEPVPEPTPVYHKPRKVVALQLLKRFRNHRHVRRPRKGPPSVVLSKLAVDAGLSLGGLIDELEAQANHLEEVLRDYPIEVTNPRCPEHDVLTDRWPATEAEQREFYRDVRHLQRQLAALRQAPDLKSKQAILADLFGERATTAAFESLQRRFGDLADRGAIKVEKETAGIALAASGIAAQPASAPAVVSAPRHHSHADATRRWKS